MHIRCYPHAHTTQHAGQPHEPLLKGLEADERTSGVGAPEKAVVHSTRQPWVVATLVQRCSCSCSFMTRTAATA